MSDQVAKLSGPIRAQPRVRALVSFAAFCSVLAPLNSTMVAVALPEIRDDFGLSRGSVGWLISAYLITMAVAQPVAGRLGDQMGRGRLVRISLTMFVAVSVATSFSPNFSLLMLLRALQAIFGAALIPNALALIRERAPDGQLGRLNGLNAAAIAAAAGVGPLLGAAALALGSWRFVFPASLPFALVALLLLPHLHINDDPRPRASARPDWLGTAEYAGLLIAVSVLLSGSGAPANAPLHVVAWFVVGIAALLFAWGQRRSTTPVAAWNLFRYRSFLGASTQVLLINLTMYTTLLMVPFVVSDVLGGSATASGALLGTMALFMGLAAPPAGRLSDVRGRRFTAQLGAMLALAAVAWLEAALWRGLSELQLAGILALLGIGVGTATAAANTAAIESVPKPLAGTAAGTSSMMRYVGSIIGTGVLSGALNGDGGVGAEASDFSALVAIVLVMTAGSVVASRLVHVFPPQGSEELTAGQPPEAKPLGG